MEQPAKRDPARGRRLGRAAPCSTRGDEQTAPQRVGVVNRNINDATASEPARECDKPNVVAGTLTPNSDTAVGQSRPHQRCGSSW